MTEPNPTPQFPVSALSLKAQSFSIVTHEDCQHAADFLVEIKALRAKVSETFDPIVEAAHKAHTTACRKRSEHIVPLDAATEKLKEKIGEYNATENARALAAHQQALEAAEEAERVKREKDKEVTEEAIRMARMTARVSERAGYTDMAIHWRERANELSIAQREADAAPIVAVVEAPAAPPKVAGVSTRQEYDFVIEDEGKLPREYLVPDEKAIRAAVRSLKEKTRIPGVRVTVKTAVAVR